MKMVQEAGFTVRDLEQPDLPGPRPWTHNDWGVGVRAA